MAFLGLQLIHYNFIKLSPTKFVKALNEYFNFNVAFRVIGYSSL